MPQWSSLHRDRPAQWCISPVPTLPQLTHSCTLLCASNIPYHSVCKCMQSATWLFQTPHPAYKHAILHTSPSQGIHIHTPPHHLCLPSALCPHPFSDCYYFLSLSPLLNLGALNLASGEIRPLERYNVRNSTVKEERFWDRAMANGEFSSRKYLHPTAVDFSPLSSLPQYLPLFPLIPWQCYRTAASHLLRHPHCYCSVFSCGLISFPAALPLFRFIASIVHIPRSF